MKTMCAHVYHYNGFVTTHPLGHMSYDYTFLVPRRTKQCTTNQANSIM